MQYKNFVIVVYACCALRAVAIGFALLSAYIGLLSQKDKLNTAFAATVDNTLLNTPT